MGDDTTTFEPAFYVDPEPVLMDPLKDAFEDIFGPLPEEKE